MAGESGCGKSTLASTVLRLQPKDATVSGEVLVNGADVLTMRWGDLRALRWAEASIVFQGALHSLNPVRRVEDQVGEPMRVHERGISDAEVSARVAELLQQVGLPTGRAAAYPHQLSGGQKQRVMVAMALACRPQLIVADEPTTALDVMVQAQILDLMAGLVRDLGVGMVIISHDLSVLADVCDRVAVMYAGRVVETGTATEVFTDARSPLRGGVVEGVPADRRSGGPLRPRRPAGRPAGPARAAARVSLRAALPPGRRPLPRGRAAAAGGGAGSCRRLHPGGGVT